MDISFKGIFQCNICSKPYSIRIGSFYFSSNLSLQVQVAILYFFSNGCKVTECLRYLEGSVSKKTCIQWYAYYRDIMTTYLRNHPVLLNGIVHVDDTATDSLRKYNRGHQDLPDT